MGIKSAIDFNNESYKLTIERLRPVFIENMTNTVFHYCDCSSLVSILDENELWLSNISFMNDKQEIDHSLQVFKKSIALLDTSSLMKETIFKQFSKVRRVLSDNLFILSLSKDRDSLNLWNNYTKNEGYNIGINSAKIVSALETERFITKGKKNNNTKYTSAFGSVLYDEKKQIEICTFLFERLLLALSEKDPKISVMCSKPIWTVIQRYSFLFKSNNHQIENEFRIIIELPNNSDSVRFRSRNGLVLPYIRLGFGKENLPITDITIGPKVNDSVARKGIQLLSKMYSRKIKVSNSKIKLRF